MTGPGDFYGTCAVEDVIDGDTFRTTIKRKNIKVRIMGINTPESGGYREEEAWGQEAKIYAKEKLQGRFVHLYTDPGDPMWDQYHRLLAHVVIDDGGINYGVQAVADGMAHAYIMPHQDLTIGDTLRKAERLAKDEKRGMWRDLD
ncbi:thermonuclease family protein [Haloglycomyces albus]|uniref:thermonuclease family protein n=1 Tax=Haloglycomyces albus TaxID=526067 RepID=UPI00046D21AF|nr:thermonuclease family protein [Haloglycomyces albus]